MWAPPRAHLAASAKSDCRQQTALWQAMVEPWQHRFPEGFRHRQQVLRSYTAAGDMLDTTITDGPAAETAILRLLSALAAAVVHSRNVQAGCHMFAIRRR